jgi:putative ABC transport system permease protein
MLKNYLKTAWRNIWRSRLYSGITVLGLMLGLAVGILILLWVGDETSFDGFHPNGAAIYRVNDPAGTGAMRQVWSTTAAAVAPAALKEVSGVVNAVRIYGNWDYAVYSWKNKLFDDPSAIYADASLFQVFGFKLLQGNPRRPWPDDQSVIITQSTAKKYFGTENPMGKVIQGDHKDNFQVSGVIADFPDNSSIRADMLFPMSSMEHAYDRATSEYAKTVAPGTFYWHSMATDWGDLGFTTFLQVQPGADLRRIGRQLVVLEARGAPLAHFSLDENAFELQPLSTIHLREPDGKAPALQTVQIFLAVAIFILLIASINYVNLSTARAMLRAREVGVRKIVGAARGQLFAQFIVESLLFYSISLLLALGLIVLVIPYYNAFTGKHFVFQLTDMRICKVVAYTSLGTLVASAVYPALLLSSFRPLQVLKGKLTVGLGDALFRKVLVTTQFVFSIGLMISTLVIARQLRYIRDRDPGYDRSQVFLAGGGWLREHAAAVRAELSHEPAIRGVSMSSANVIDNGNTTGDTDWDGKAPNSMFVIRQMSVDEQFIPLMKMKLAEGSNFTGIATDSMHYILNETAVRRMGLKDPVGKRFKLHDVDGTIIGVVRDFNYASPREQIEPAILSYRAADPILYIKTSGRDAAKAIAAVRKLSETYHPGFPFDYAFLDQRFSAMYRADRQTGTLFQLFAGIAIFISCLGLFALAFYMARMRTREIGIRKVLGASVASIITLLSRDFLRLVAIAIVVASPLAWLYMHSWLQRFAYRIAIGWWVFLIAGGAAVALALLTIGWQSVRAAIANPVDSLRNE